MKKYFLIHCGFYAFIWSAILLAEQFFGNEKELTETSFIAVIMSLIFFYPSFALSLFYKEQLQQKRWLIGCALSVVCSLVLTTWVIIDWFAGIAGGYTTLKYLMFGMTTGIPLTLLIIGLATINKRQLRTTQFFGCCILIGVTFITFLFLGVEWNLVSQKLADTLIKWPFWLTIFSGITASLISVLAGLKNQSAKSEHTKREPQLP